MQTVSCVISRQIAHHVDVQDTAECRECGSHDTQADIGNKGGYRWAVVECNDCGHIDEWDNF